MGEYADMAVEQAMNNWMGEPYFGYWEDEPEDSDWAPYSSRRSKHRKRRRINTCKFCGKYPLMIEEFEPGNWHLSEFDENNIIVRHVCKMKKFGARAGR